MPRLLRFKLTKAALSPARSAFIAARIVAAVGILDLDDFGAEIRQRLRAGGTGDDPGEIHDQETVERRRPALRSRRAIRQLRSGRHDYSIPLEIVRRSPTR